MRTCRNYKKAAFSQITRHYSKTAPRLLYTKEPLHNGHLGHKKVVVVERFKQESRYELSTKKVAVIERTLLWRGGHQRFDCIYLPAFLNTGLPKGNVHKWDSWVPCKMPSLPNPTTRKGWPHHQVLRPLPFTNSDVGSFMSHKNKSVKVL